MTKCHRRCNFWYVARWWCCCARWSENHRIREVNYDAFANRCVAREVGLRESGRNGLAFVQVLVFIYSRVARRPSLSYAPRTMAIDTTSAYSFHLSLFLSVQRNVERDVSLALCKFSIRTPWVIDAPRYTVCELRTTDKKLRQRRTWWSGIRNGISVELSLAKKREKIKFAG